MDKDTISVVTTDSFMTRGSGTRTLEIDELAMNVRLFIEQIGILLKKTPEELGVFHFEGLEVYAEVTGKGTLVLLGSRGEEGTAGGLKFVFRRSSISNNGQ